MVAEPVAFSPIVNVAFNPPLESRQIARLKMVDVVWKPEGNDESFLGVSRNGKVPHITQKSLVYPKFLLVANIS